MYYTILCQSIIFGSTLDSIIKSKLIQPKISQDSIDLYLVLSYIPTPKTIYEGIFKLEPSHLLKININVSQILDTKETLIKTNIKIFLII